MPKARSITFRGPAARLAFQSMSKTTLPPRPIDAADRKALALVGDGCDVTDFDLASRIRDIANSHPDLLWVGDPMGTYAKGAHHPYLGAKLTAKGKAEAAKL